MFIKCLTVGPIETNCYIVCDKIANKAAIIDPGADAPRIISALEETGCEAQYVIFTHGHGDHISAAHDVLSCTGAKLAVYTDELPLLNDGEMNLSEQINKKPNDKFEPDIILHDGDTIMLGTVQLKVIHTPGHTFGSCCILEQDTLFSGDTLFRCGAGRTDFPTGDFGQLMQSLKKLFALEGDLKVLPGHGEFTTLDYERKNNPYAGSSTDETIS